MWPSQRSADADLVQMPLTAIETIYATAYSRETIPVLYTLWPVNVSFARLAGAGSSGIFMQTGFGANVTLDARNVIARGAQYDVFAEVNPPPGTAVVNLTTSNYATTQTSGASASITPAGTNGNQTAAPVFANATAGDFHELAGSPTVDAGSVDSLIGAADLDGMPRIIDATHRCDAPLAVPDIGAFELSTPAPSCPSVAPVGKATLGQIKRNKRRGTAIVPVIVPGPGSIGIAGKGVKPVSASALTAGTVKLLIKSAGKARARLRRAGAAKVAFTVTYAPNGGSASTESARVKLIRR